jgi:pyridoxal phosphate-dependent aminotransferase EpsN
MDDDVLMSRIFLSAPHMSELERKLLVDAFDSNWIAPVGPDLEAFETDIAAWTGTAHAVALSSGTAGLHLALMHYGVGPGDEVIVPTLTFAATANAVAYTGATSVFLDSEPLTMNLDPQLLAEELAHRSQMNTLPKVIITVDLYGQCAQYENIRPLCERYEIPIIEDAAEAVGASRNGQKGGSFGDVGVVSFNGNKIVTTSGGGALVCDDASIVHRARYLATQARQPVSHYEHLDVGYNYRLSNLLAAIGRGQLSWLEERIERRKTIRDRYMESFADIAGLEFTTVDCANKSNYWLTTILVDSSLAGVDREQIRLACEARDIECRALWKPMHQQPVFASSKTRLNGVSDRLFRDGLCLPSGSAMTDAEQDTVIATIRSAVTAS